MNKKETKDFEVNNKGQIKKISNLKSEEIIYYPYMYHIEDTYCCFNLIKNMDNDFLKTFLNMGFLFNTKENAEKFIEYIKNYNKE